MAIYRFRKPLEEAVKDYLADIERDYNKSVIIEKAEKEGITETEKHKITVCYCAGNKIKLIIKEKGGKQNDSLL